MPNLFGSIAPLLWSLIPTLSYFLTHIDSALLLSICFLSFAFLGISYGFFSKKLAVIFKQQPEFYFYSVLGIFGFHFFYFLALKMVPAIAALLIVNTGGILIIIYNSIFNKVAFTSKYLIGFCLCFLGILFIVSGAEQKFIANPNDWGYLFAFLAANCWSIYTAKAKQFADTKIEAIIASCLYSGIISLIWFLLASEFTAFLALSLKSMLLIIFTGVFPMGASFFLWYYGNKHGNVNLLAIISYIAPILGTIWLILLGISNFYAEIIYAFILIFSGIFFASGQKK